MTEDRDEARHPSDVAAELAALRRAISEGPVRLPTIPPSEVPTGLDARLLDAIIREKVALFLTSEQIDSRIDRKIGERLQTIGLPVDEDHIEETSEAVRSAMKWHKRIDKVVAGMAISVLVAIGYALLGLIGIRLPPHGAGG